MTDRRLTPANGRVAHVSLRGIVHAETYTEGEAASVALPLADLCAGPGGPRDRQLLHGDDILVLERRDGHAFVRAAKDGYCGYLAEAALGPAIKPSHWVAAPASHLYLTPRARSAEAMPLSLGARLTIVGKDGDFQRTASGQFVPAGHLRRLDDPAPDPVAVAERFLGTPYLWGGNSHAGIDCSGLVQAALLAAGIPCPGDSDLQEAALGAALKPGSPCRRGDLLFWKGHVAMAVDEHTMIHANGHRMAVTREDIKEAIARIATEGPLRVVKRL